MSRLNAMIERDLARISAAAAEVPPDDELIDTIVASARRIGVIYTGNGGVRLDADHPVAAAMWETELMLADDVLARSNNEPSTLLATRLPSGQVLISPRSSRRTEP